MGSEIEYDVADRIANIALNRPEKMNAGTATMVGELVPVLDLVDGGDDVRAVILITRQGVLRRCRRLRRR